MGRNSGADNRSLWLSPASFGCLSSALLSRSGPHLPSSLIAPSKAAMASLGVWSRLHPFLRSLDTHFLRVARSSLGWCPKTCQCASGPKESSRKGQLSFLLYRLQSQRSGSRLPRASGEGPRVEPTGGSVAHLCRSTVPRAPPLCDHPPALHILLQEQHVCLPAGRLLTERLQQVSAHLPVTTLPRQLLSLSPYTTEPIPSCLRWPPSACWLLFYLPWLLLRAGWDSMCGVRPLLGTSWGFRYQGPG